MTAVDAFHAKSDAYQGLLDPFSQRFIHRFAESFLGKSDDYNRQMAEQDHDVRYWFTEDNLAQQLAQHLTLAETFYVAPQMHDLVTAAAAEWVNDEPVDIEDFPSPAGWMWMRGGLTVVDIRGLQRNTSAISWLVRGPEVYVTWWADKRYDAPHEKRTPGWDRLPRLTPWHMTVFRNGHALPMTLQIGQLLPPEVAEKVHWTEDEYGVPTGFWVDHAGWTAEEMNPRTAVDPIGAWLMSALRIMQTPLADVSEQGLPAQVRRSLKGKVRLKNTRITVIEFRRRTGEWNEGSGREYTHRWLRRGHWRKQWRGSDLHGDRRQVRIWIHPTLCGPDDKPVIWREHVNALIR